MRIHNKIHMPKETHRFESDDAVRKDALTELQIDLASIDEVNLSAEDQARLNQIDEELEKDPDYEKVKELWKEVSAIRKRVGNIFD